MGSNPKATMGLNEAKFGLVAPFWFMDSFIAVVGQRVGDYRYFFKLLNKYE